MELLKPPIKASAPRDFSWVVWHVPRTLVFGVYIWLLLQSPLTSRWLDFPVYWDAGKKALLGSTVYDVVGHFQYKYSPLIALLFGKAFQSMTFESASWVFQKAMLFLWLFLFLKFSRRNFNTVFFLLLFFGNALRLDLELGQINALVLYLLTLLFASLERESSWKKDLVFAFLFSIAIQLKLFCFILVPLLLLQKEWRKLSLGLLFLPLLSIGGVAATHGWDFAWHENQEWMKSLTQSTDELLLSEQNVALLGVTGRHFGLSVAKGLWLLAGGGFFFYLAKNRGRPIEWFRNRLLYAIALFNPLVWSYWILYATPLFIEEIKDFQFPRDPRARLIVILSGVFLFAAFNGQHAHWVWNGGILLGLILLAAAKPLDDLRRL